MNRVDRLKILVRHLITLGIVPNQKGLGEILGYKNESYFSQIINNKVPLPEDFINKIKSLDERINEHWLIEGTGEMLIDSTSQINNSGEFSNTGDIINTVTNNSTNQEYLEIIKSLTAQLAVSQQQVSVSQEQMNRLITIIENKL